MSEGKSRVTDKERAGTRPAQPIASFTTTFAKFQSAPSFRRGAKSIRVHRNSDRDITTTVAKNACYDLLNLLARGEDHGQPNWTAARIAVDEKSAVASLLCSLCVCFCACCYRYVFSLFCDQGVAVAADVTVSKCLERVVPGCVDDNFCNGGAKS